VERQDVVLPISQELLAPSDLTTYDILNSTYDL